MGTHFLKSNGLFDPDLLLGPDSGGALGRRVGAGPVAHSSFQPDPVQSGSSGLVSSTAVLSRLTLPSSAEPAPTPVAARFTTPDVAVDSHVFVTGLGSMARGTTGPKEAGADSKAGTFVQADQSGPISAATSIPSGTILPTDPLLAQQWHLGNPTAGLLDLNVRGAWNPAQGLAYTGAGIRAVIIDDGFDYNHTDLAPNYNTGLDYDFAEVDLDPFGGASDAHGTAVTGIIGADNNGTGAVGVAFDTQLVGYRTLGVINDTWLQNVRDAIHHAAVSAQGDVANISQGIANDLNSEFGVGYNAVRFDEIENSIGDAVGQGRGGLGMTIVKSAGNSRSGNFDVNADDWTNDTRQVVVAAVDQNGFVSSYSSYGAAVLVSGFGTPGQVVTTDRTGAAGYNNTDFTSGFNGTSAAAPMVTGVVALIYDANPNLGWRDVQSILADSARQVGSEVGAGIAGSERYAWQWNHATNWNGGGRHFSNDYGYGLVDGTAAVRMAESWLIGKTAQVNGNQITNVMDVLNASTVIPDGNATGLTFNGNAAFDDLVDRVTVRMTFSTTYTGDLELYLTSPDGTVSELIRDTGTGNDFNGTWTFESQAFRGERAAGQWSVRVVDDATGDALTVSDIVITTWGQNVSDTADRYVYTNEYSDYDGVGGHLTTLADPNGGIDTVNAAAVTLGSNINLVAGAAGSIDGAFFSTNGSIENAIGGDGNDTLTGNASANELWGFRGNDSINGGDGTDKLYGGDGDDTLSQNFGGPNETMDGGSGTDTADWSYSTSSNWNIDLTAGTAKIGTTTYAVLTSIENAVGGALSDTITGSSGPNNLSGGGGNDFINGGSGTDSMYGGAGDDTLSQNFGGPNEIMDGGADTDTGDWSYSTFDSWNIDLAAGTAKIGASTFGVLTSIENAVGGSLNDTISGTAGANVLNGGLGNDILTGLGGDDSYWVNTADDQVVEASGGGNDTVFAYVSYTLGVDASVEMLRTDSPAGLLAIDLTGNGIAQELQGNAAANALDGKAGADTMTGFAGDDSYAVDVAGDRVIEVAAAGNDTVFASTSYALAAGTSVELLRTDSVLGTTAINLNGNELAQAIEGNDGVNLLDGKGGADTMTGYGGNDAYAVDVAGDQVIEAAGQGSDTVFAAVTYALGAGQSVEDLRTNNTPGTGAIKLTGNEFAQYIYGNAGANTLNGLGGVDTLTGFAGNDSYVVDVAGDQVIEAAGGGTDIVYAYASYALGAGQSVEVLRTDSDAGTGAIKLTGNEVAQYLYGNAGANTLNGLGGADTMTGLGGNDSYVVDVAGDRVIEAAGGGTDIVYAYASYTLAAGQSVEVLRTDSDAGTGAIKLTGNEVAQYLYGNAGANTLNGLGGADTMTGLGGNDSYVVDVLGDQVVEAAGGGTDIVYASTSYVLGAGQSVEVLRTDNDAGTTAINLVGNDQANIVIGNAGANILDGGAGKDSLTPGNDAAIDTIRFTAVSHSTSVNRDTITGMDFNEDKLDFTVVPTSFAVVTVGALNEGATFDANLATAVNAALAVNGSVLLDPNGGNLNIAGHYYLVVDANGDGNYTAGSDYVAQIVNPTGTLDLSDFV